jgi:predicted aldo/keto reductase-like oxidoreductase
MGVKSVRELDLVCHMFKLKSEASMWYFQQQFVASLEEAFPKKDRKASEHPDRTCVVCARGCPHQTNIHHFVTVIRARMLPWASTHCNVRRNGQHPSVDG